MIKQRSFLTYILLSIVTCGIYSLYFWYKYSEDVNIVCAGDGENTTNGLVAYLLGSITCGIYLWYWNYTLGNRMQKNAPRYGLAFAESGTTILLWFLVGSFIGIGPFVGMYLLIKNMNLIAERYNAGAAQAAAQQVNPQ